MPELYEFAYRVRRYYKFYNKETLELLISVVVIAFCWAFNDGAAQFEWNHWLGNFLLTLIMVLISFFIHVSTQKIVGVWHGFRLEYHFWVLGLLASLIITFLTNGHFPVLLPGGVLLYHMAKQRIGEFRMGLNFFEAGLAASAGPLSNILFGMLSEMIFWTTKISFFHDMYIFNIVFALYMFLPLPNMPGMVLFFASRLLYVFYFGSLLAYVLLILLFEVYSLIWAVILGGVIWALFNWFVEQGG